jgi:ligand-binding sensor domain-containing protein
MPTNFINWIVEDNANNIWVATQNGIVKFASDGERYIFRSNMPTVELPSDVITAIQIQFVSGVAIKWFATERGLVRFHEEISEWRTFDTLNSELPGDGITALRVDLSGNKWLSAYNHHTNTASGLIRLNSNNTIWTRYSTANSQIPSNNIRAITSELGESAGEPIIWMTTDSGIARLVGSTWTVFNRDNTQNTMPSNQVFAVKSAGNNIRWFGTVSNMVRFDGTNWSPFSILNAGIPNNHIQCLTFDSSGNTWIGTANGLTCFDGTNWTVYNMANTSVFPSNDIRSVVIDGMNNLWIGTTQFLNLAGGIVRYNLDNHIWDVYTTTNSNLTSNRINRIVVCSEDTKWIATAGGGLVSISSMDQWRIYDTSNTNIPSNDVTDVYVDRDDVVWVATNAGFANLSGVNTFTIYNRFNSALNTNNIRRIKQDKLGFLWIITDTDLVKFSGNNMQLYNQSNSVLTPSSITDIGFDKDNLKWITTTLGLFRTNEIDWRRYEFANSPLNSNNLRTIVTQDVLVDNQLMTYKWIASADSGLTVFRGGNQTYNSRGYISIFQHPVISNSLKISGIVNNVLVSNVNFSINNVQQPHSTVAANTYLVEYLVPSSQNISIRFRYWHAGGDTTIVRNLNVSLLSNTSPDIYLDNDISLVLSNSISGSTWLLTDIDEEDGTPFYRFSNLPTSLSGNIQFDIPANYSVYHRAIDSDKFLPQSSLMIHSPGDYRIVKNTLKAPKPQIALTNYPNPFNPSTLIQWSSYTSSTLGLESSELHPVVISIYNMRGQKVTTLVDSLFEHGSHNVVWNGIDSNGTPVGSGVYFVKLTVDTQTTTQKIVLLK